MSKIQFGLVSVASLGLVLGSVFNATPVVGATLTRQDFSGNFTSIVSGNSLLEKTLPVGIEYSGFLVYEDNGTLGNWEVNVNKLNLNLNPDSTLFKLTPKVNFKLSSESNWNLVVDFGIAFDAPLYSLRRTSGSLITLSGEVGLIGGYTYTDPVANVTLSSFKTSVIEPTSLLGLLFGVGGIAAFRKASKAKA